MGMKIIKSKIQNPKLKIERPQFGQVFAICNLRFGILNISLLIFLTCSSLVAQDFKKEYKRAKELYNEANYSLAMDAFKSLMVYDRNNPYPEYACFYYALSAHRLGFSAISKEMFVQTKKIYSEWDQLDEVDFLL